MADTSDYCVEIDLGVRVDCPSCQSTLICDESFVNTNQMVVITMSCPVCGEGKLVHLFINRPGKPLRESLLVENAKLRTTNILMNRALKKIVNQESDPITLANAALEKDL